MHIPEDIMDPILDTLRSIDIMGELILQNDRYKFRHAVIPLSSQKLGFSVSACQEDK